MQNILTKIDKNISDMGERLLHTPKTDSGKYFEDTGICYDLSHIYSTKQSYYTAMAILAYRTTKDEKYLTAAVKFYHAYYKKVTENPLETTQEYGFMYYLYGVQLYNLTGDEKWKKLALLAADALAKRFIPNAGYIKAWGHINSATPGYVGREIDLLPFFNENRGVFTADSMVNLPILFWASEVTKHPFYRRIAEAHIERVRKYLIRKDYSVNHAYRFFEPDGSEVCVENYDGGYSSEQAALMAYGFVLCYKHTQNGLYLTIATKLMLKFVETCGGRMPRADFEDENSAVDTLAAAVALCAIKEITMYTPNDTLTQFADSLPIKDFISTDCSINGILKDQNGGYDITGDYFIAEYLLGDNTAKEHEQEADLEFFIV